MRPRSTPTTGSTASGNSPPLHPRTRLLSHPLLLSSSQTNSGLQCARLLKILTSLRQTHPVKPFLLFRPRNCPTSRPPNVPVHDCSQESLLSQPCLPAQGQQPRQSPLLLLRGSTQATLLPPLLSRPFTKTRPMHLNCQSKTPRASMSLATAGACNRVALLTARSAILTRQRASAPSSPVPPMNS